MRKIWQCRQDDDNEDDKWQQQQWLGGLKNRRKKIDVAANNNRHIIKWIFAKRQTNLKWQQYSTRIASQIDIFCCLFFPLFMFDYEFRNKFIEISLTQGVKVIFRLDAKIEQHSQDNSPWTSYRMINLPFIWNWLKFYSKMAADVELLIIPNKMGSDLIMKLMFEYSKPFNGCWKVSDYTIVSHSTNIGSNHNGEQE